MALGDSGCAHHGVGSFGLGVFPAWTAPTLYLCAKGIPDNPAAMIEKQCQDAGFEWHLQAHGGNSHIPRGNEATARGLLNLVLSTFVKWLEWLLPYETRLFFTG